MNFKQRDMFLRLLCTLLNVAALRTTTTSAAACNVTVMRSAGEVAAAMFLQPHHRRRRYLLFQKGSNVAIQTNFAKALVSEQPRGFNEIVEYTIQYDLPHMLQQLHPPPRRQPKPTTTTTTEHMPYGVWQHAAAMAAERRQHAADSAAARPAKCKALGYDSCTRQRPRFKRRAGINAASHLLFDLITLWARIHAYDVRHCIMRTLCEAAQYSTRRRRPHAAAQEQSLLHDLLRILLRYALPAVERQAAYAQAWQRGGAGVDCAPLYGPHCRLSVLQQIMRAVAAPTATAKALALP